METKCNGRIIPQGTTGAGAGAEAGEGRRRLRRPWMRRRDAVGGVWREDLLGFWLGRWRRRTEKTRREERRAEEGRTRTCTYRLVGLTSWVEALDPPKLAWVWNRFSRLPRPTDWMDAAGGRTGEQVGDTWARRTRIGVEHEFGWYLLCF